MATHIVDVVVNHNNGFQAYQMKTADVSDAGLRQCVKLARGMFNADWPTYRAQGAFVRGVDPL